MRSNQQIRAKAPEFLRQPVSHIQRNTQRRGRHRHPQCQGSHGQQFALGTACKGIRYESKEHFTWSRVATAPIAESPPPLLSPPKHR